MLRVVKVGGSLLDRPGLPGELRAWLQDQPALHNVVITGGGRLSDAVRQLDRRGGLTLDSAHHLAIRAMSVGAWTLSQLGSGWLFRDSWSDVIALANSLAPPRTVIFDPAEFLKVEEPSLMGTRLPVGWQVTSDSIAARIAELLGASELVLLKSKLSTGQTMEAAARLGDVDAHFPIAAVTQRHVRAVDLPRRRQITWRRDSREVTTTTDRRDGASACAHRPHDA